MPRFHLLGDTRQPAEASGFFRRFIEHDHNGLFARDIAKSVLRDSIEGAAAERLGDFMHQIEFPQTVRAPFVTARTGDDRVPDTPTMGYEVYLGRRARWEYRGAGFTLMLENYDCDGAPWFRLSNVTR